MEEENTIGCCCCDKIYDTRHPEDFKEKRSGKFISFRRITETTIGDYKELYTNLAHKLHIGDISCRKCAYKVKDHSKSKSEDQDHTILNEEVKKNKIRKISHGEEEKKLQEEKRAQEEGT
jgi:hypothetical protein